MSGSGSTHSDSYTTTAHSSHPDTENNWFYAGMGILTGSVLTLLVLLAIYCYCFNKRHDAIGEAAETRDQKNHKVKDDSERVSSTSPLVADANLKAVNEYGKAPKHRSGTVLAVIDETCETLDSAQFNERSVDCVATVNQTSGEANKSSHESDIKVTDELRADVDAVPSAENVQDSTILAKTVATERGKITPLSPKIEPESTSERTIRQVMKELYPVVGALKCEADSTAVQNPAFDLEDAADDRVSISSLQAPVGDVSADVNDTEECETRKFSDIDFLTADESSEIDLGDTDDLARGPNTSVLRSLSEIVETGEDTDDDECVSRAEYSLQQDEDDTADNAGNESLDITSVHLTENEEDTGVNETGAIQSVDDITERRLTGREGGSKRKESTRSTGSVIDLTQDSGQSVLPPPPESIHE